MNKLTLTVKILSVIAAVSLFTAVGLIAFDFFKTREHLPPHSYIGKLDVSGLNKEEAALKIRQTPISNIFEPMVYFNAAGESFSYSPQEIGIYVKAKETVNRAFSLSQKESYLKELRKRLTREVLLFPIILDVDAEALKATVQEIAGQIESVAQDATITLDEKTGGYHITEDLPGRKLDVSATIKEFHLRLNEGKNSFPLVLEYYEFPRVTEDMLRVNPPVHKISSFTTYYGAHDSPNRIHNIKLIASWIDNTLLLPGEEFSLLKSIGRFTPDRGFKQAYVIVGGVLEPQYGGGTCQIGTTLYNTVALADIEVLSRRNHSLYFNIYPLGRDATVYPGSADLKFKNNTGKPIFIKAEATNKYLHFAVYGTPTGKKVVFSPVKVYAVTRDGMKQVNKSSIVHSGGAFRTIVTRKVFDNEGNLLNSEEIKSFYKLYGDGANVKVIRREGT